MHTRSLAPVALPATQGDASGQPAAPAAAPASRPPPAGVAGAAGRRQKNNIKFTAQQIHTTYTMHIMCMAGANTPPTPAPSLTTAACR